LGIEIDLMGWRLLRRWESRGDIGWPMLEAVEEFNAETQRRKDAEGNSDVTPRESTKSLRLAQDTAASSAFYFAQQSNEGRVEAAGAVAECAATGLWLWGSAATSHWVTGHFGEEAATLKLTTPEGTVTVTGMGTGVLHWDKGEVRVETTGSAKIEQS